MLMCQVSTVLGLGVWGARSLMGEGGQEVMVLGLFQGGQVARVLGLYQ